MDNVQIVLAGAWVADHDWVGTLSQGILGIVVDYWKNANVVPVVVHETHHPRSQWKHVLMIRNWKNTMHKYKNSA